MKIGMKKGRPPIKVKRPLAYTLLNFIYKASLPLLCHILLVSQCYLSIREQTLTLENLTQRIDRLTDSETTLFRFEDGNYDNSAIRLIQEAGGYPVQWNINSMDWKDYGAQDILHRILNSRQLQNGSILLFHAGTVYTAQALPDLIDNLEDQGYQPVPISELIWKHSYYMDADGVQIPKTEP